MGKAVYDILRENGATWITVPGDFTKRVTTDKKQLFVSLAPGCDKVIAYCKLPSGDFIKALCLPYGFSIPRNVSHDDVVANLCVAYPELNAKDVFELKNKYEERIALAYIDSLQSIIVYGMVEGEDRIL